MAVGEMQHRIHRAAGAGGKPFCCRQQNDSDKHEPNS